MQCLDYYIKNGISQKKSEITINSCRLVYNAKLF